MIQHYTPHQRGNTHTHTHTTHTTHTHTHTPTHAYTYIGIPPVLMHSSVHLQTLPDPNPNPKAAQCVSENQRWQSVALFWGIWETSMFRTTVFFFLLSVFII